MGKMLESLRHPGATPVPPDRPRLAEVPAEISDEADPADEMTDIPFIEVPEPTVAPSAEPSALDPVAALHPGIVDAVRFAATSILSARPDAAPELVVWREPHGVVANQYRRVRDGLLAQLHDRDSTGLLFLPISHSLDVGAVVLNLAAVWMESARGPILVIDPEVTGRSLAARLQLAAAPGWSEVLAGLPPAAVIQESGLPGLHVIAAGNRLAGRRPTRVGERLGTLLAELHTDYPRLLIVGFGELSPSLSALAAACDGVCLVGPNPPANDGSEGRVVESLHRLGARVLGTMVVSS